MLLICSDPSGPRAAERNRLNRRHGERPGRRACTHRNHQGRRSPAAHLLLCIVLLRLPQGRRPEWIKVTGVWRWINTEEHRYCGERGLRTLFSPVLSVPTVPPPWASARTCSTVTVHPKSLTADQKVQNLGRLGCPAGPGCLVVSWRDEAGLPAASLRIVPGVPPCEPAISEYLITPSNVLRMGESGAVAQPRKFNFREDGKNDDHATVPGRPLLATYTLPGLPT